MPAGPFTLNPVSVPFEGLGALPLPTVPGWTSPGAVPGWTPPPGFGLSARTGSRGRPTWSLGLPTRGAPCPPGYELVPTRPSPAAGVMRPGIRGFTAAIFRAPSVASVVAPGGITSPSGTSVITTRVSTSPTLTSGSTSTAVTTRVATQPALTSSSGLNTATRVTATSPTATTSTYQLRGLGDLPARFHSNTLIQNRCVPIQTGPVESGVPTGSGAPGSSGSMATGVPGETSTDFPPSYPAYSSDYAGATASGATAGGGGGPGVPFRLAPEEGGEATPPRSKATFLFYAAGAALAWYFFFTAD